MRLAFRAQALGPLRNIDWTIPEGVSVIVGPNRVGKSTLLRLPEFVRLALAEGVAAAVKTVFEGGGTLRNLASDPADPCSVGIGFDIADWDLDLAVSNGAIPEYCGETLRVDGSVQLLREPGTLKGRSLHTPVTLGPRPIPAICIERVRRFLPPPTKMPRIENRSEAEEAFRARASALAPFDPIGVLYGTLIAAAIDHCLCYRTGHYQIPHILKYGSPHSPDMVLHRSGENVFPLLRNWRDRSDTRERYDFVFSTLREAFPDIDKVSFEQAGQTVTLAVQDRRWGGNRVPISRESTGLITALLQLCAVASGAAGGLVTIDGIEVSLHPHALRVLIHAFRQWAAAHDLRIVLATQSETVLRAFTDDVGQLHVLDASPAPAPRPLTSVLEPDTLAGLSPADLLARIAGPHE
jgi:hypothetical protein